MSYLILLAVGLASGFLSGLLGIGGGLVVVPALMFLLPSMGVETDVVAKVAIATSLAAMIPTAISTVRAQYKSGQLDLDTVKLMAPMAAVGAVGGAFLLGAISSLMVTVIFAGYAAWVALRMFSPAPPQAPGVEPTGVRRLMVATPTWGAGMFVGGFSAMAGIGGATLTVPFLLARGVDMRRAAAIASAVGLALAIASCATFVTNGTHYVMWSAMVCLSATAPLAAPYGVRAAQRLPVAHLKKAFGLVLVFAAVSALTRFL